MNLLADILPVLLFFAVFKLHADPVQGVLAATGVAMAVTLLQVAYTWLRHRRANRTQLITLALVVGLGGATLLFRDPVFIKWKPTAIYWLFALTLLGSHFVGDKPILQRMMGHALTLPAPIWRRANLAWAGFFALMGAANVYVAFHYSLDAWVNFKTYWALGATFAFVVASGAWLGRHAEETTETGN